MIIGCAFYAFLKCKESFFFASLIPVNFGSIKVPLGHVPEMPTASCMEITMRQGGKVTSGLFWLGEAVAPFLVTLLLNTFLHSVFFFAKIQPLPYNFFLRKDDT